MPAGFEFPHHRVDLWLPLVLGPDILKRENRRFFFAYGRMSDGVTIRSAQTELTAIGRRLENAYPSTNRGFRPFAKTFRDRFIGRHAAALYSSLWGAVGFVLLIACANLASFLLSRAAGRSREISVRMALGAAKRRIVRQLLIESIMLSSLGGVAGWFLARGGVRAYELLAHSPGDYDRFYYSLDYTVLFYLAAISISVGLLFGLAPAAALSKLDINTALRDGGHGATSGARRKRLSTLLIVGEVALAVVLLAGAGVMVRSFLKIYTANPGVNTTDILTASVAAKAGQYPDERARIALFERIAARLKAVPGVDSLAMADAVPGRNAPESPFELAGKPQDRPIATAVSIFPGYFRTLGARVLAGREFNDFDGLSAIPVAIVNRQFANRFWPREDPIGKRFRLFDGPTPEPWRTVIGIASNIVQNDDTGQTFYPVVYVPFRQRPATFVYLLARTDVPPESLETAFERQVQTIDPDLILSSGLYGGNGPAPLSESALIGNWSRGFNAVLFLVFAAIALLLAAIGLYAVIAHSISRRTQEIGIRMALGATARDTRNLIFRQGMLPVGIGLAIGLPASFAVNRLLKSELVGVSPNDPITLLAATTILMLAAALACLIPARRAARIDPAVSLRYE
jgi:predicted permease